MLQTGLFATLNATIGVTILSADELASFKQQLLELRQHLLDINESASAEKDTVELDQSRMGRLSRMDAMQGQQMALEAARRREQQLLKIGAALRRIDNNEFGDCFVCGNEIDLRRLQADPTSNRCIQCAE